MKNIENTSRQTLMVDCSQFYPPLIRVFLRFLYSGRIEEGWKDQKDDFDRLLQTTDLDVGISQLEKNTFGPKRVSLLAVQEQPSSEMALTPPSPNQVVWLPEEMETSLIDTTLSPLLLENEPQTASQSPSPFSPQATPLLQSPPSLQSPPLLQLPPSRPVVPLNSGIQLIDRSERAPFETESQELESEASIDPIAAIESSDDSFEVNISLSPFSLQDITGLNTTTIPAHCCTSSVLPSNIQHTPNETALWNTQDIPHADPGTPHADPDTPHADPGTPHADPGTPHADPGTPHADPGTPHADPGTPPFQDATSCESVESTLSLSLESCERSFEGFSEGAMDEAFVCQQSTSSAMFGTCGKFLVLKYQQLMYLCTHLQCVQVSAYYCLSCM